MAAEQIYIGKIYTANEHQEVAEAMLVVEGKIAGVGTPASLSEKCTEDAEKIYVDGIIIPGITEGHAHITCSTEMIFGVALGHANSPEEYLEKIRDYYETNQNATQIVGSGYDNGVFGPEGPTAKLLDCISRDIPIVMIASDHHSRWLNSKALEMAGIEDNTTNPENGEIVRDKAGKATGWLKETAMAFTNSVIKPMTAQDYAKAILYYQQIALTNGVTIAFEPMFDSLKDYETRANGYELLAENEELLVTFRLGYSIEADDDPEDAFTKMNRIRSRLASYEKVQLTTAKFFVDGVVECHTAYLREPYADTPGDCGKPTYTREQYCKLARRAAELGYDLHSHVIGDAAADMALEAYAAANGDKKSAAQCAKDFLSAAQCTGDALSAAFHKGDKKSAAVSEAAHRDTRYCLTHLQILQQEQMEQMGQMEILAVTNPYWHYREPVYYEELEKPFLGEERAAREYPMKSLLRHGVKMSQASDFPVTIPPNTMESLHLMVNRQKPGEPNSSVLGEEECLSVKDALDVLTIRGAYQNRLEKRKGSLEEGKDADFVVLDRDVLSMNPKNIYQTRVVTTYIAGNCVWQRE
ncbi:MAG: amidohydrolase [Lachnospiraceae bacterium]